MKPRTKKPHIYRFYFADMPSHIYYLDDDGNLLKNTPRDHAKAESPPSNLSNMSSSPLSLPPLSLSHSHTASSLNLSNEVNSGDQVESFFHISLPNVNPFSDELSDDTLGEPDLDEFSNFEKIY